ncbi:hypothetical protein [Desulforhabdus amnigena]|jgi:hypothetical protein|nr:hypothetical protein [Desulforhabdus amnigena]
MKEANIRALFIMILSVAGILVYCTLSKGHDWGGDFAAYIMQARSIFEGNPSKFIEENSFTMLQSSRKIGPIAYPWGFPALLSPLYGIFGINMIALKSIGAIFFLFYLCLLFIGFRKYHSSFWVLCLVCIFSLNPFLLEFLDNVLSDIPFLLFSTITVLLIGLLIIEKRQFISPICDNIVLGILIAIAFFVRTNGILLLLTLTSTQLFILIQRILTGQVANFSWSAVTRSHLSWNSKAVYSCLLAFLPYVSFLGLVLLWNGFFPDGGSSHMSYLSKISMHSIFYNLLYYAKLPADFFSMGIFGYLIYVITIPYVIKGLIIRYRSDYHIIIYVILTILLYIFWPERQGLRFLFPVLPFCVSFALIGMEAFQDVQDGSTKIKQFLRKKVSFLLIFFVISSFGIRSIRYAYLNIIHNREISIGPFTATSEKMFSFINENTKPESTVIFFKPRVMRMMTGRKSIIRDTAKGLSSGDYLCLKNEAGDQVSPKVIMYLSEHGAAQLIYENSEFKIYQLMKDHIYRSCGK